VTEQRVDSRPGAAAIRRSRLSALLSPTARTVRAAGVELVRTYAIVLGLVVLVAAVASQNSIFVSRVNLLNISSQYAPAGIMAAGLTFVLIAGGIDLSIGANYNLCAVVAAAIGQHHDPGIAFLAALGLGTGIGLANALIVTVTRIDSFIATLGVSFVLTSISQLLTGNHPYYVEREDFLALGAGSWHTIPYNGMILLGTFLLLGLVLARGAYGQKIYAIGGNREASRLAGLRVQVLYGSTFVLVGFCCGLGGILNASQLGTAQYNIDPGILFDVVTMVVLGGTSLLGGYGAMWRTVIGWAFIASIANSFNILNVNSSYQNLVKGVVLIGALAIDVYVRRVTRAGKG
jgi:ribose transport system permease protein